MSRNTIDHELRYTWQTVSKMYNEEASKIGGSMAIGFALLSLNPKKGTPSTSLGPKMGMESRSLTRSLKSMLDRKLIRKKTDPKDKRKVRIYLTKKGIEYRKIASKNVKVFNERVFSKISSEELNAFYKVLEAVDQSIEELKNEK